MKYSLVGMVTPLQASKMIRTISSSKKVEIASELPDGRLNHIVIKGTKTPVGYLGSEKFELVNADDSSLNPYHHFLRKAYKIITNLGYIH